MTALPDECRSPEFVIAPQIVASSRRRSSQSAVPEASDHVVVHETDGLHERVADRGTDELEPAAGQLLAHATRLERLGGDLRERRPGVPDGASLDELPDELGEAAELPSDLEDFLRVDDGRLDLQAISHDARISHQGRLFPPVEPGDLGRIEAG